MEKIVIKFAKHQRLPDGYRVEFWECVEKFVWVNDKINSCSFSTKWQAYRAAWMHFNEPKIIR